MHLRCEIHPCYRPLVSFNRLLNETKGLKLKAYNRDGFHSGDAWGGLNQSTTNCENVRPLRLNNSAFLNSSRSCHLQTTDPTCRLPHPQSQRHTRPHHHFISL